MELDHNWIKYFMEYLYLHEVEDFKAIYYSLNFFRLHNCLSDTVCMADLSRLDRLWQ